jgi:hypothetical protein
MASGHVSRIKRPNTWLRRPMLQNVKKALAKPEPSTHGTKRTSRPSLTMSVHRGSGLSANGSPLPSLIRRRHQLSPAQRQLNPLAHAALLLGTYDGGWNCAVGCSVLHCWKL